MPQNQDTRNISQNLLYPIDDPNEAFRNALQDIGINVFRSNPFVSQMQKSAQGARIGFLADRAFGGAYGADPNSNFRSELPSQAYGQYLRSALQGGNLLNQMHMYTNPTNFRQILDKVRGFQDQMNRGELSADEISPYMSGLNEIFSADGGRGALAAYGSMRAPLMGSLGSAYTRSLSDFGDSAMRRFAREADMSSDPWQWLFRGSPTSRVGIF